MIMFYCKTDIKVKEQSIEALMKGKKEYEPARFMTVDVAARQLLDIIELRKKKKEEDDIESDSTKTEEEKSKEELSLLNQDSICIGLARIGSDTQMIRSGTLSEMASVQLGPPLHALVITGKCHPLEVDMIKVLSQQIKSAEVINN